MTPVEWGLLGVAAVALLAITLNHRRRRLDFVLGVGIAMLLLVAADRAFATPILEFFRRLPGWLRFLDPGPRTTWLELQFFSDSHYPGWLATVFLLVGAAGLWIASRPFVAEGSGSNFRFLEGAPLRRLYQWMLGLMCLVVLAYTHGLPWLRETGWDLGIGEGAETLMAGVIWTSPLVLCAVLAGAARPVPVHRPAARERSAEPPPRPPRIAAFLDHLESTYGQHTMVRRGRAPVAGPSREAADHEDGLLARMARALDPVATAARPDPAAVSSLFGNFWGDTQTPRPGDPEWSPWNVLIAEDLTQSHLRLITTLIQSCHDRGGTALVLAPSWSIGRIARAVAALGQQDFSDLTLRSCTIGEAANLGDVDGFDDGRHYNLIFASSRAFESRLLAAPAASTAARIMGMLHLVVVLDFHAMEAALLRLRLARLKWRLEQREIVPNIRVVCQTENRSYTALGAMRDTFAPIGSDTVKSREMTPGANRHVVLWRGDQEALEELATTELGSLPTDSPVEVAPLTAIGPLDYDLRPHYHDSVGRWDREIWRNKLPTLLKQRSGSRGFDAVSVGIDAFAGADVHNIIVEDWGNLAEALHQHRNFAGVEEYVVTVIVHRYPMRAWFLQRFASGPGLEDRNLMPIAPATRGGLTELAVALAEDFKSRETPVSQDSLNERFRLLSMLIVRAFKLHPTPDGVRTLFERERRGSFQIEPHRGARLHDIAYRRGVSLPPEPSFAIPVRQQWGGRSLFTLSPGDHGLHYAAGTTMHYGGQLYQIVEVRPREILVRGGDPPRATSRNAFLFSLTYQLDFRSAEATLAIEERDQLSQFTSLHVHRVVLRGEYRRRTVAVATVPEALTPFTAVPDGPRGARRRSPGWTDERIAFEAPHASIMLLRLQHRVAAEDAACDRGPTAFTLAATLQDVLASMFPPLKRRIAVMSPQAAGCVAAILSEAGSDNEAWRFPIDLYPRLVAADLRRADIDRSTPAVDDEAAITAFLTANGIRHAVPGWRVFDLIVVEDADHELGVVRALFNPDILNRIRSIWGEYLAWLATNKADPELYHRFGSGELAPCFAFADASKVVGDFLEM